MTEHAADGTRRHRRRRRSSTPVGRSRRRWLRPLYFAIAAMWGYVSGVAIVGALGSSSALVLAAGALVAASGGALSAVAYRQARQRLS